MLPFEDSRRLLGGNLFFGSTGAVLEAVGAGVDAALIDEWRRRADRAGAHVGWTDRRQIARRHAGGVSLAINAPLDHLFLATEINEWALCTAIVARDSVQAPDIESLLRAQAIEAADGKAPAQELMPVLDETAALARFDRLAALEARPALRALMIAAAAHELPAAVDDDLLTVGAGMGARSFAMTNLPDEHAIPWKDISDIPIAIVTGSNGKTTTVRLIAACARAQGWHAGYNCTDGVFLDDEVLATGDYSGPAGARMVLREPRAQAAILETARGGILRRGIAVSRARAAVVTNVSSDHFGEYGIDDLAGLADAKLSVAGVLSAQGRLVLNADDAGLRAQVQRLPARFGRTPLLAWFSNHADPSVLQSLAGAGSPVCGVSAGRLYLAHGGSTRDLGAIVDMPLTVQGAAAYNVANLAAAALAAAALGIDPGIIAQIFARFGSRRQDNPGRMMRFDLGGVRVLIDYAHNPDGLRGFLTVAEQLRGGSGRLGLMLGHAGNRQDADIAELARTAAEFKPELIVVKEDEAHLRGRAPGEVPRIIRAELEQLGFAASALPMADSEIEAVRMALRWARPGDVLALPVHSASARTTVIDMFHKDAGEIAGKTREM